MKKKRERAKWTCLILCCLSFLAWILPPVFDLVLRDPPDWLVLLSPSWPGATVLYLISLPLLDKIPFMDRGDTVISVLQICVSLIAGLPLLGWVRMNQNNGKGRGLARIPLLIEIAQMISAVIGILFLSIPLILFEFNVVNVILYYALGGALLSALIFRSLYIWQ